MTIEERHNLIVKGSKTLRHAATYMVQVATMLQDIEPKESYMVSKKLQVFYNIDTSSYMVPYRTKNELLKVLEHGKK